LQPSGQVRVAPSRRSPNAVLVWFKSRTDFQEVQVLGQARLRVEMSRVLLSLDAGPMGPVTS
jgi:hypothetical protein